MGYGGEHPHGAWIAQCQQTSAEEGEEVGRVVKGSREKDASLTHPVADVVLGSISLQIMCN